MRRELLAAQRSGFIGEKLTAVGMRVGSPGLGSATRRKRVELSILCPHFSPVKMALDLAVTGMQALQLQGKPRRSYRIKASTSYVDETLFGSPSKATRMVAGFEPPWVEKTSPQRPLLWSPTSDGPGKETGNPKSNSPASTPRKKYRVKSRSPSFCDETLFGPKLEDPGWEAPWAKKEDTLKLRPLLWTPPSAPRVQSTRTTRAKPCPLKAIHPETSQPPPEDFVTEYKGKTDFWKRPENEDDSASWSDGGLQSCCTARPRSTTAAERQWHRATQSPPDAAPSFRNSRGVTRPRSASFSGLDSNRRAIAAAVASHRPPWK
ncbi:RBPJ-interacting and tubulin-associated protein 1 isoform X2 [Pleurodeles waltl]|uniref:RBPJ-interacting and tubulin-associated protein 1 isoform X2 n=1 Tax=Pleurodeles waltl TaxID=8319 RepID=UPI003709382D